MSPASSLTTSLPTTASMLPHGLIADKLNFASDHSLTTCEVPITATAHCQSSAPGPWLEICERGEGGGSELGCCRLPARSLPHPPPSQSTVDDHLRRNAENHRRQILVRRAPLDHSYCRCVGGLTMLLEPSFGATLRMRVRHRRSSGGE